MESSGGNRSRAVLVAGAIAVVTVGLIAVVVLWITGGESEGDAVATVRLMSADDPGPDPFFESVVSVEVEEAIGFANSRRAEASAETDEPEADVASELTVEELSGATTTELYGSSAAGVCDRVGLREGLRSDPQRAQAWAGAAGVGAEGMDEIDAFVGSLVPVVLAGDVAVTNHSWTDGSARPFQSVLQGGTAVLVDDRGVPRVQCSCGNPLAEPDLSDGAAIELEGEAWEEFDPERLAAIAPSEDPLDVIEAVEISTGEQASLPVGGELVDGMLEYGVDGLRLISDDGRVIQLVNGPVEIAEGDGKGGVIFVDQSAASFERPPEGVAMWHLPAGQSEPVMLLDLDSMSSQMPMLHGIVEHDGRSLFAFDLFEEIGPDNFSRGDLHVMDMDTGEISLVAEGTSGVESGIVSLTSDGDVMTWLSNSKGSMWVDAVDRDFAPMALVLWDPLPDQSDGRVCLDEGVYCARAMELLGDGEGVLAERAGFGSGEPRELRLARVRTDGSGEEIWVTEVEIPDRTTIFTRLQAVGERGLITAPPPILHSDPNRFVFNALFDVETGEIIEVLELEGAVALLDGPLLLPAESQPQDESESGVPDDDAESEPDWDESDVLHATFPADTCYDGTVGWPHDPIPVVGGEGEALAADGSFGGASMSSVTVVDSLSPVGQDDEPDGAVVTASCFGSTIDECCAGRTSVLTALLLVRPLGDGSVELLAGPTLGGTSGDDAFRQIIDVTVEDSIVIVTESVVYPERYTQAELGHPPEESLRVRYEAVDGAWVQVN